MWRRHWRLRHLEDVGFAGATRIVGTGFDAQERDTLSYIEGDFTHPGPWTLDGAESVGLLLRQLHAATASCRAPRTRSGIRGLGAHWATESGLSGTAMSPWNVVSSDGRAMALIDWDRAGPVDPLVELAQACWLNAKLHDDIVAEREGLPSVDDRARQLRAIVDAYGLSAAQRRGFVDHIVEFTIHDAADEADLAHITAETTTDQLDPRVPWALAWRARAGAWQLRNRKILERALD